MEIGILGPLAVAEAGRDLPVAGAKPRLLLAALALRAGSVVPADRLVDDLWGQDLPQDPANALQALVSRLRRSLVREGLVIARPPGYLLAIDPGTVDAVRFERLAAAGRRALADGAPEEAAATLRQALGLWRGPALADTLDGAFAGPAVARLEALRLAALADRVEADLALGRHAELVGELEALVAEHPLHERLRGQLMRALYGAGRQTDALAAYRQGHELLAAQGLDPSPELRRLESALLTHDAGLAVPAPPACPRGNLRAGLTSFVGREREAAEVRALLAEARLVTLTGPGGVGKTRLASRVAADAAVDFADGAWLVELAGVAEPPGVAPAVAAALGVRGGPLPGPVAAPAPDPAERLLERLGAQQVLLVLDNCEHLTGAVAALAETILSRCREVRILATSREALGVGAEARWPVPPLRVPPAGLDDPRQLERYGASELFVERARAVRGDFTPDAAEAAAISDLCRRLDGLPLAIELAAARVPVLSVGEIAARLDDRFRLLVTGSRTAVARQRTLRAAVDWSWDLLDAGERGLLGRLSLFSGWRLADAEATAGPAGGASEVLDILARLVDKSLVVVGPGLDGERRYRLLETVREYARERLELLGDAEAARRAHARSFVAFAEAARPGIQGPDQLAWIARVEAEHDNLRAALRWAVAAREAETALRLTAALGWFWWLRGHREEMGGWLRAALAAGGDARTAHRADSLLWLSLVAAEGPEGTEGGVAAAEEGRALHAGLGDPDRLAFADLLLCFQLAFTGRGDRVAALLDEGAALSRDSGNAWVQAIIEVGRAGLALASGLHLTARGHAETALSLLRPIGERWGTAMALEVIATSAEIVGDYDRAVAAIQEITELSRQLGMQDFEVMSLARLGNLAALMGDPSAASRWHERAEAVGEQLGARSALAFVHAARGLSARRRGDLERAAGFLERALARWRNLEVWAGVATSLTALGTVAELQGDHERAAALLRDGLAAARRTGDPRALAFSLEALAALAAARGRPEPAALLLGHAAAARAAVHAPLPPAERLEVDRAEAAARAALGGAAFAHACERGSVLTLDAVLATAGVS